MEKGETMSEDPPFIERAKELRDELDIVAKGLHNGSIKTRIVDGRVVMELP